jgi:hypothetical protein
LPFKSAAQNVPRVSLVTEMLRNTDIARFVTSLLPSALKENRSHRVLLAFNAATLHEFISRSRSLNEGTMAYILPALLEPLERKSEAPRDAVVRTSLNIPFAFGDSIFFCSLEASSFYPHWFINVSSRCRHSRSLLHPWPLVLRLSLLGSSLAQLSLFASLKPSWSPFQAQLLKLS